VSTILIGVSGSPEDEGALAFARACGGRAVVASAFGIRPSFLEAKEAAERARDELDADEVHVLAGAPAPALRSLARSIRAHLIVVGAGPARSTGERLLHGAPCPVAIVPRAYRPHELRRVGVAVDGSSWAHAGRTAAEALARAAGAELVAIRVPHGDAANAIADRTAGLDLLVLGSRGLGPAHAALSHSVTPRVARQVHCPVIVVPRFATSRLGELFEPVPA
jgi:nucleotide-binding universal stress UspA family protein